MLGIFAGIATVAAAVIACVALYVQHRSFRLTLAANLSMNLDERFNSEELRSTRALAARSLKGHVQEKKLKTFSISSIPSASSQGVALSMRSSSTACFFTGYSFIGARVKTIFGKAKGIAASVEGFRGDTSEGLSNRKI